MRAEASVPIFFFILERLMWLLYVFVYVCACLCVCWYACLYFSISGEDKQSEGKPILSVIIGAVVGSVVAVAVIVVIVIVVIRRRRADPTYASPKSRPAPGEEHEYMDLSDTAGQPNRTADSEQRKQEEGAYEVPVFPPS